MQRQALAAVAAAAVAVAVDWAVAVALVGAEPAVQAPAHPVLERARATSRRAARELRAAADSGVLPHRRAEAVRVVADPRLRALVAPEGVLVRVALAAAALVQADLPARRRVRVPVAHVPVAHAPATRAQVVRVPRAEQAGARVVRNRRPAQAVAPNQAPGNPAGENRVQHRSHPAAGRAVLAVAPVVVRAPAAPVSRPVARPPEAGAAEALAVDRNLEVAAAEAAVVAPDPRAGRVDKQARSPRALCTRRGYSQVTALFFPNPLSED